MGETLSSESSVKRELGLGIGLSKDSEALEIDDGDQVQSFVVVIDKAVG